MNDGKTLSRRRRLATDWKTYVALAAIIFAAVVMLFGFDSRLFKPATGSANAMALSADR